MRKLLALVLVAFIFTGVRAQSILHGQVKDKLTGEPIAGATISWSGSSKQQVTNDAGMFHLGLLPAGPIKILFSHISYETLHLQQVVANDTSIFLVAYMVPGARVGSEIVISASRQPDKITNAPAAIQVITHRELEQFAGSNPGELLAYIPGLEYTRTGVAETNFNARGLNSAFNNKVMQLVDGRNSMSPLSAGLAVMNRGSTIKEDIDRMEIVFGPQSALYGPNAHNALFHTITIDPRKFQGTTVALSAGNREQFATRLRHAYSINDRWAYKLTGEHATGKEFDFRDSVYAGNQPPGTQPFFGPPVAIPERNVDLRFRNLRGEGHLYYRVASRSDLIVSMGTSKNDWVQVTTAGRNQMKDVTYRFLQARLVHKRLYLNIYNTWGSLGNSYVIGNYTRDYWNITHSSATAGPNKRLPPDSAETYALRNRFKEDSRRLNAELQYHVKSEKAGLQVSGGLNYQREQPNGYGITLVDSFRKISIAQYGAVLQVDKTLPWGMRFITAGRLDQHENFGTFFSPRVALLKNFGDGSFRITWGRAYAMPSIQAQYSGIGRFLFGNAGGIKYIKTNTRYSDAASVAVTTPLQPEEVSTLEFGFKGTVAKHVFVDVNYYNGLSKNFISPARSVAGRVVLVNGIPVTHSFPTAGSVVNDTLRNATFSTFFNYGDVRVQGLDAGWNVDLSNWFRLSGFYSWIGSDISEDDIKNDANKDGYVSLEERSLNAPRHRAGLTLGIKNLLDNKLFINLSARFIAQYDFYSASQIGTAAGKGARGKVYGGTVNGQPRYYLKNFDWGPLGGFTTIDLNAGYRLTRLARIAITVSNLFDTEQMEFVGAPSIGRLYRLEMTWHIPGARE